MRDGGGMDEMGGGSVETTASMVDGNGGASGGRTRQRRRRMLCAGLGLLMALVCGALGRPGAPDVAAAGFPSGIVVSTGYADSFHSSGFFPAPWFGSPGVVFQGCGAPSSCSYDGGAIEVANNSGGAVTVNGVQVQFDAACSLNIWPANTALPAGGILIDAQTASGAGSGCPSGGAFDTSDVGPNGTSWVGNCNNSGLIPQITVTINGAAQTYSDQSQVLNTGGIDLNSCPSGSNESEPWSQLGGGLSPSNLGGSGPITAGQIPTCNAGGPVNCATGNHWVTLDELRVPGRGIPVSFALTYNSQSAGLASPAGFGWSFDDGVALTVDPSTGAATVIEENGSTVPFAADGSGGFAAPAWVPATLAHNADGTYTFVRLHGGQTDVFSASGQLLREVDRNGYATEFAYSGDQLTSVSDASGRSLVFGYGANGDIASATDPAGRTVTLGYDSSGDLTSLRDPAGGVTSFTYDGAHRMVTQTDPRGGRETTQYDSLGRATSQTDPMGRVTTWSYLAGTTTITDPNGNVSREHFSNLEPVAVERGYGTAADATWTYAYDPATLARIAATDPDGHTTMDTVDAFANELSQTDPLSRTTTYTYNGFNEPLTVTDPQGITTSYTYDARGNRTTIARPLTATGQTALTTLTYGDSGHPGDVTAMTDANGATSTFAYDASGDLIRSADPLGDVTTYAYDVIGRCTSTVSPNGNVAGGNPAAFTTSYTYDALGNLLATTDPLGHASSTTYDADSNRTGATDADGNVTSYAYDADNELTTTTRADSTSLRTGYDADGNVTSQTDGGGAVTAYAYDPLNRVIATTDPLLRTTHSGYDAAGNQITVTDPSGRVTTNTYDAANEVTHVAYADGVTPAVAYTYTPDGQRSSMVDGTGTTTYSYDSLNRLTASTDGAGQAVGYGYDLKGQVTQLTYPNGQNVTRGYDAAGRLTSVTDWNGHTTGFQYDNDGNETSSVYPNSTTASMGYNAADQLLQISDAPTASPTSPFASFSYTRDPIGQLASTTPTGVGQSNETYSYTALNQLQSVNSGTYTYNPTDTIATLASGGALTYDAAGELTSMSAPATTFTSDAQGNRVSSTTGSGTTTYTYDQANRLTQVSLPAQSSQGLLSGGELHSLALQSDGSVWAWGNNADGQLGVGTTTGSTTPVVVGGLSAGRAVAAGDLFSLALRADGTVWAWGDNTFGQLGTGTTSNALTPVQVSGITSAEGIAAGNDHSLALLSDGTVRAWGYNGAGELGNGTTTTSTTPVVVSGLSGIVQVAAGGLPGWAGHSLALRADGTVWAWGYNKQGQLGNGTQQSSTTAVQVAGLSGVIAIAASGANSYALRADGTVWAWGDNGYGQLGNTSAGHVATRPVQVSISGARAIAAGGTHALAIRTDGTVWAWGNDNTGQLGDGGACGKTCTTPVHVSSLSGATAIAGGYVHSLAAVTSGSAWSWGSNTAGQLGDGSTAVAATPVQVSGLTATQPVPSVTSYTYDGDGLRASKAEGGATQHFAWDQSTSLPLLLSDGTTSWIYGPGGLPLEQVSQTSTLYYYEDQLGSTRLLADGSGTVQAAFTYDAYGSVTASAGTATTPLLYAGQYRDSESGLYYLRARYYDPTTAQFLSRDPAVATTLSPYGYVAGNPLNATDPSGLGCSPAPWDWGACAADVWNHSIGSFDWGTTAAGVANVVYGGYKIVTGVDEAAFSVALLFTPPPFNALAIPAGLGSVYQVTTGVAREVRGVRQLVNGFTKPATNCTVGDNTLRFVFGVLPGGGAGTDIWDWLGGAP